MDDGKIVEFIRCHDGGEKNIKSEIIENNVIIEYNFQRKKKQNKIKFWKILFI